MATEIEFRILLVLIALVLVIVIRNTLRFNKAVADLRAMTTEVIAQVRALSLHYGDFVNEKRQMYKDSARARHELRMIIQGIDLNEQNLDAKQIAQAIRTTIDKFLDNNRD